MAIVGVDTNSLYWQTRGLSQQARSKGWWHSVTLAMAYDNSIINIIVGTILLLLLLFCHQLPGIIIRASSILQHTDLHAVLQNSPFVAEFAACHIKCGIAHFFATFISNSSLFGLLFIKQ